MAISQEHIEATLPVDVPRRHRLLKFGQPALPGLMVGSVAGGLSDDGSLRALRIIVGRG